MNRTHLMEENAALRARLAVAEGEARDCVCKGNWRILLKEIEPLIGRRFRDRHGREYTLFGLVDCLDDYCYGMFSPQHGMVLLTCVGSIENQGFEPIADTTRNPLDAAS